MRFPELKILLGVWHLNGGAARVREQLGDVSADLVGTTLAEVASQIRQLAGCGSPAVPETGVLEGKDNRSS